MQTSGSKSHVFKIPVVVAVAVAMAMAISACGGDDSSATTDASTTSSPVASQDESKGSTGQNGSKKTQGNGNGQQAHGGGSQGDAESGETVSDKLGASGKGSVSSNVKFKPAPLKVSGGGSEQYTHKYGDNSIQEFGVEASESELQEAAETVHGYLVARGLEQWTLACSYMSDSLIEKVQKLVEQSPENKDVDCPEALDLFTVPAPDYLEHAITEVDAGSLRYEGDDQAFLLYWGFEKHTYAMPMNQRDGEWKVSALESDQIL